MQLTLLQEQVTSNFYCNVDYCYMFLGLYIHTPTLDFLLSGRVGSVVGARSTADREVCSPNPTQD